MSTEHCRMLRRNATDAERRLWSMLRNRQIGGLKFRRQYAFGPYVLDFFCLNQKLAIEADGGSHLTPEGQAHDRVRTEYLQHHGVRVLRFTNTEILNESEVVPCVVWDAASAGHSPHPNPLPTGEGMEDRRSLRCDES